MKNIAVYCGSSKGINPIYTTATQKLGKLLAQRKINLIYGAGNVGLMGVLADEMLEQHAKVVGVIPQFLKDWEVAHQGLTELIVVDTMHQRKQIMADRSDGVIALPGGFGTLDELFEMLTWGQLHLHAYPIGILNINGYYDYLVQHLDKMVVEGFLSAKNRAMVQISSNPEELLESMESYVAIEEGKWVTK